MKTRVQITTYVAAEIASQLEEIAERQQRSVSSLLRLALFDLLEREKYAEKDEAAA